VLKDGLARMGEGSFGAFLQSRVANNGHEQVELVNTAHLQVAARSNDVSCGE